MQTSKEMLPCKYYTWLLTIIFLTINLSLSIDAGAQSIYSTNQAINVAHNKTITYCIGDPVDLLVGYHDHRDFVGQGIDNAVADDGLAFFDPAAAGIGGPYTISYHGSVWFFVVTANPAPPTLQPFPAYCTYSMEFPLSGGSPADPSGKYYVNGVEAITFNPSSRGAGIYNITYSVGNPLHCLATSSVQTLIVKGNPIIFNQPATPVCSDAPVIDLTLFVSPAGGTFSGTGVIGNTFDPSKVAAPGTYTIRYTYSDATCTFFVERSITVNPVPVISITGLGINHCDYNPDINFTYSPVTGAGGSGILTGDGITDLGGGNAIFSPSSAGLGYHNIKYIFNDINGCSGSKEILLRVGTDIKLTGLGSNYCSDAAPVTFNYSHWGGAGHTLTISGGAGLTDNGNGSAIFNPSVAGVGNYTITYKYTDDLTCLNHIDHFVQVLPVPVAQFSGLDPAYCEGAADVSLTGNPPNGTFSGPAGSILNMGGMAVFRPSALSPGGPYPVTYSFTNSSGCSDSETKNLIINPLPVDYLVTGTGSYCQGSVGLPVTLFDSDFGVNYQLYKNGVIEGMPVAGTGNAITWPGKTAGNYTVRAIVAATGCTRLMSGSALMTELAQSAITKMPDNETVCETGTAVFTITATGQNLSYAWTKNSIPVGGNSNIITIPNVSAADNGHELVCTVSSTCGAPLVSNPAVLTVLPATAITLQPSSYIKCTGGSVSFTITAAGSTLTYQWRKGGADIADIAGKISGSKTSTLSISSLAATDEDSYTCFVTGTCGSATSNPADLKVDDPIVVTLQPVNKSVCLGDNTSFNVTATGTNLSYQWYFNNNPVPGATNPIYPFNPVASSDAGTYYCAISSPCLQVVNTNIVSLVIRNATAISSNPAGSTVCQGGSKNFTVVATGSNLTYQWFKDGNPVNNDARITGATLASLSITGLTLLDAGNYACVVSGDCGSLTTPAATLNVEQAVTFNSQPVNRTVCPGSDATFSVNVNGTNLAYEWQKNSIAIFGAVNPDFTVAAAAATDAGNYRCRITNACGSVFSSEVSLTVDPVTAITTQPVSVPSCENLNVSFSVAASGSNLTYQWYKNSGIISGAQNTALNLLNITSSDAASYTCVVKGTCGTVTSASASLAVDVASVITAHPQSKTVCPGMPADLSVVVPAGTNLKYQWVKDGVNVGTNSPVYSIPSFAAGDAGSYHVNITNNCGTVISNTAVLSVGSQVNITSNPVSVNACNGGTANFSVSATGSNLTYQWQKDGFPLSNGGTISGSTSPTLTLNGIIPGDNGNYRCIVTNSCNSQVSASASLTVSQAAVITLQPQSRTGCTGEPLNIMIVATGTNLAYQWYRDGAPVGINNPAYTIPAFAAGDAGTYRCEITNGCGTVVSDNAVISAGITTNITAHPSSASRCIGNDMNFSITATGSDLTWQWKKDGVIISDDTHITGSSTNTLSITGILNSDFGTYTCNAIGNCGTITSNGAVLTVLKPVSITSQPANLIACNGDNAVFSVTATGDNLTYIWQKNGFPIVPAQTSSSLVLSGVDDSHEGVYNCIVSNSCSSEISTSADLVVDDNLVINDHPDDVTQCEGTNVSFTVSAAGPSNTTYQWYKDANIVNNGPRISGALSPVLNVNSIIPADAGSYSCRLTSSCGFDESDIAVLTVQKNVTITVSPVSFSVLTGNTASFTVVAAGNITGYQWRKNGVDLIDGGNISGALTANLTIANTTITDEGAYTCFVTGICNSIPSNPANLTVLTTSAITVQPVASVTVCAGGTLNLFITTSGSGHTYQWKKDGNNISNGGNISGATASSLTVSNLTTADQGAYTCLVDNIESSTPSVVIVNPLTIITLHPADAVRCVNGSVTFSVAAEGAALTYQWQKNTVNIIGAINSSYTIDPLADGDDGVYTCVVTGVCGPKTSNPATLVVNKNTVITTQPSGSAICEGNSITLSVAADGDNLTYQWKKGGSPLSDLLNISGTKTSNLVISNALPSDGGEYNCTVTGACGSETSNFATLVVDPVTVIKVQPIGRTKCAGDNVVFAVNASGQNLAYQWQRNGSTINNDGNITGATTSTLNIASLTQLDHQGTYTCVVTGICGPAATSDPAVLTVSDVTLITSPPSPAITICQGASTNISVSATGGGLTFQWRKNGSVITDMGNISGTATNNLVISNAATSDAGFYNCTVTGNCGSVTSSLSELQVNPVTVINMHPAGQTLCEGDNVQFMVSAVGAGPLTYQWKKDNNPIPLANSNTLTLNGITTGDAGAYSCTVTGSCGAADSNPASLIVNPKITISVQPVNASVCENNAAIFSLNATGTNLIYKWKYNNGNITDDGRITGSATNELRIAYATAADEGIYKCEITSTCGTLESNSVILTVDDLTAIVTHPVNQTVVQGSAASFSISASGIITGYQWRKDGINLSDGPKISGSGSAILNLANVAATDAGSYQCVVTGKCGQAISNPGVLTVIVPASIVTPPASQTKCTGESVSFSVTATGSILSYQWKLNGINLNDGANISGSKTPDLVIASIDISHTGLYTCVVTGNFNTANSQGAVLTVNEAGAITGHPSNKNLCEGDWLVLEVTATGSGITYLWEKNNGPITPGPSITGINGPLLVITNVTSADAGSYRCIISNPCKTEISNPAIVTINPTVSFAAHPVSDEKCELQTTSFSVVANGVNISYQWFKNGTPLANTARITGVATSNLTISNLTLADQGNYYCYISDNCSSENSAQAVLTIKALTVINSQPADRTVCEGQNAFFEVTASGNNLLYQWQKDGAPVSDDGVTIFGSNSSVLTIQNTTTLRTGVYRCLVTGSCNSVLSNPANLVVNPLPGAAGAVTGDNLICQAEKNVLYVVPEIANASGYVWSLPYGATIVSGAGTRSILVDFSASSISGTVSVHGTNACGKGPESTLLAVTVNPIPVANAGPDQVLCSDATSFNANVTTFGTWTRISGMATIANPNLPNSPVTGLGQGTNTFAWTVTENGCVAEDIVNIINRLVVVDAGADQTICSVTTTLNANIPVSGQGSWSVVAGGGTFTSNTDPKTTVNNLARGTNILRWSINNSGCVSYDEITIINDLPSVADAGPDVIILVDNYTLSGNVPAIGTGYWTLLSGSAIITNPAQNNTIVTNLGIEENIFRWTITKNLCSSFDDVKIINYTPTLTDAGPDQTLCAERTTLQGIKPNYGTGQWSVIAGSGSFVDPHKFDTEVLNIGKGQNIYRWTIYEYQVSYDDVVITNNSPSYANAGIDQRLCSEIATLAGNDPLIGTGIWTLIGGSGTITNPSAYNSSLTNLGPGSNTFRWSISNSGCSSFDEVVIINDKPTSATAGVDQVTCDDFVNLYPNTPTIGVGEWSVVQGSAFFVGNKATNLARGENLLKWTISNNGCFSSDIVSVTSNKPTVSFTGEDKSICVDNIILPGNTPASGTGVWTILYGSATFDDVTKPDAKVTGLAVGQNRFRWTITYNGCVSYSEVDINYNYIQSNAGQDQALCQANAFLNANDPGVGKGQWSVVGGSGSANFLNPNQPNTEVINLDKGVNILRWTITNGNCISYDEVEITNNMPSTAYAGSDRSVCGEQIFLNANEPSIGAGEWTVLSGSANIADPALYNSGVTNLSIGQNVLRWTITNQNCTSSDEVVIKNDQPSNIEAGPDQYNCSSSAQLYATAPVGGFGRWSISEGSATFQDNTLFNTTVSNLEKGENMLVWTVTVAGCSNSDTVIIANNLPSTPNAGPDQDICADNAYMSANQPLIGTGRWSIVSGSAVFDDRALPGAKASNLGNGPNTLRWTITNGSCVLYDEVIIRNSLPTVAYAGEDRAVCNTTANLLAEAPLSGTGSWSVVSGYGVFGDPRRFDTQISALGFGQNTLRWTTENGRCRTSDDVIITNNLAEAYAGLDQVVYASDVRLVGNNPSSGTGQWIILAGRGTIQNPSNFETNVSNLGGGANTFSWTINNDGCIASDDVVITNKILPVTDFDPLPGKGCAPLTVSFVNNSIGGAPFRWDFGDGTSSLATNTNHTYNIPGNYRVRLTATGPDGITIHKDTIVVVYEIPVAQFKISHDTAYVPGNSINFFNLTENIDSLRWDFGDGNFSKETNPSYKYTQPGSYDVSLQVWSGFQCYDSVLVYDAVTVERAGVVRCPNSFTPNLNGPTGGYFNQNDFSNDVFHCFTEGVNEYHLEIYNRLGIIIFRSDDINIGWDGYFKGKLVEEGAYVYKTYGRYNNGERFDFIGNIVLLH